MASAQQVIVRQFGGPEVLEIVDVPVPSPGPGQVLVRVEAAGILYGDVMRRTDRYLLPTALPYEPGTEVAGFVVSAGRGVRGFAAGDRVVGRVPSRGYAQYALVEVAQANVLPPTIGFAEATAVLAQGTTAWLLTHHVADVRGKAVFVESAAGGVGSQVVQMARWMGATKIIGTASSEEKRDFARMIGADLAIDPSVDGWADEITRFTGGQGVDVAYESSGASLAGLSRCLAPFGTVVKFGRGVNEQNALDLHRFVERNQLVRGFYLPAWFTGDRASLVRHGMRTLIDALADGHLRVSVSGRFGLNDAAVAHKAIEARHTVGKLVLEPWNQLT
ncbi:quinone oxidoreductase family protein [Luteibacter aegosomatissinici]|uniref:quinone oxidoreductase family protein n=1 Tax=Luteibacter aegosomatissinici TaxID=2911539 RepID=UPI001FF7409A|nr:zinc-binding dehydrogenase [Luteibacter aegosomatissinici]UPG92725.1 zinc-binding dehydrogenase [Luteibacter aegosomatissinici]